MPINFIAGSYISNEVCNGVISFFEENCKYHMPGTTGCGVIPEWKDSTDLRVHPKTTDIRIKIYLNALTEVCQEYIKLFPWSSKDHGSWRINEAFNIQKYLPTQGFHKWHTERNCSDGCNPFRHMVFMTYLNTITDGGETEWFHQNIKLKPKKGLTIIWPADWTHVHRGIPSPTQTKYIVTGWYSYDTSTYNYEVLNKTSVR